MTLFSGQIEVIAVGKLRSQEWLAAQATYEKRLRLYVGFRLTEVKDSVGRGQPDGVALQKEGELLVQAAGGSRLVVLTENGRSFTSPDFAAYLQKQLEIYGRLAFLIGGPLGFSPGVRAAAHDTLSLSPLTFPHEMARILLLEQLYRACTLRNGEKYHK